MKKITLAAAAALAASLSVAACNRHDDAANATLANDAGFNETVFNEGDANAAVADDNLLAADNLLTPADNAVDLNAAAPAANGY